VAIMEPAPRSWPDRTRYEYRPGGPVPEPVAVDVKRRSHTITAEVELPADLAEGGGDGVLLALGATFGGCSLYVQDGRLQYVHNFVARHEDHLAADEVLSPGTHTLGFAYRCDDPWGGGHASLLVDDRVVAEADLRRFTPMRWSITGAGLTCGYDGSAPVTPRYRGPFRFGGTIRRVIVDIEPELAPVDADAAVEAALAEQ
jgi:hypothetical protein